MAVALDNEFAALPHADARPGVHSFSRTWVLALVVSDVVLFLAATYLAGIFVKSFWSSTAADPPHRGARDAHGAAVGARVLAARAVPPVVRDVGARRVLSCGRRALAGVGARARRVLAVPDDLDLARGRASSRSSSPSRSIGTARAVAHHVRDAVMLARPRRIAVVGHPSRLEFAEDAMRSLPNARVFRLVRPEHRHRRRAEPRRGRRAAVVPACRRVGLRHAGVHRSARAVADAASLGGRRARGHDDRVRAAAVPRARLRAPHGVDRKAGADRRPAAARDAARCAARQADLRPHRSRRSRSSCSRR